MTRWAMVVATLAFVFVVCAPGFAQEAAKIERGKAVYAEQKCSLCHSIGEVGNKKGPLDGVGGKLSAADIKAWLTDPKGMTEKTKATRKPPMKAYPTLKAEDADALVAYIQSLKK